MAKPSVILRAWRDVFSGNTSEEHKRRAKICMDCPAAKYSKLLSLIKDELKEVEGMVCDECGCPLVAKTRSSDKCYKW